MPLITTQAYHSHLAGSYHADRNSLDKGSSHICASRSKGSRQDNQMFIGYLPSGDGFQVLFHGKTSDHNVDFMNQCILPKIEKLDFTTDCSVRRVMTDLLESIIIAHRASHLSCFEFKLGFAMTYTVGDRMYCTGFSYDRVKICFDYSELTQDRLNPNGKTIDPFEPLPNLPKNAVLFNVQIHPGDEIVMYYHEENVTLNAPLTHHKDPILYTLMNQLKTVQSEQSNKDSINDWIFGRMVAQDISIKYRVKAANQISWLKGIIRNSILEYNHAVAQTFFKPVTSVIPRLTHYLHLLDQHHEDLFICLSISQLLFTDPEELSWFRHFDKMNFGGLTRMINTSVEIYPYVNDAQLNAEEIESLKEHIKHAVDKYADFDFIPGISQCL